MQMERGARGGKPGLSSTGSMAARNYVTQEGDYSRHIICRIGREEEVGGLNMEDVEDREAGQGDKDPREC